MSGKLKGFSPLLFFSVEVFEYNAAWAHNIPKGMERETVTSKGNSCAHLCKFDLKRLHFSPLSALKCVTAVAGTFGFLVDLLLCVKEP